MSETKLNTIELDNGHKMIVEVVDTNLPEHIKQMLNSEQTSSDLPKGAEAIGIIDDVKNSMSLLKEDLKGITNSVKNAFDESKPDEFSIEVSIGFTGEGAIPFIASAKSNAGIKVKATWKKEN